MRSLSTSRGRSRLLFRLGALLFFLWLLFSLLRMPALMTPARDSASDRHEPTNGQSPSRPPAPTNALGLSDDGGRRSAAFADEARLAVTLAQAPSNKGPDAGHEAHAQPGAEDRSAQRQGPGASGNEDTELVRAVTEALRHSWRGYRDHAFGHDEYLPLSNVGKNWGNGQGIGVTMIDALDTLLMAGLHKEAEEVIDWIEHTLTFDQDIKISVFETTIRVLGGLLSAYQWSGREALKVKAVDLGNRILRAFETPSGVPDNYVNLRNGHHEGAAWNGGAAILSELGSLQMEFRALSDITGDKRYDDTAQRAIHAIRGSCGSGLCPRNFHGSNGVGGSAGLGSFGDSFYEYLLKYWLLVGKQSDMYRDMWDKAADHIVRTSQRNGVHLVPNGVETGMTMEHLACFSGGLFALSYAETGNREHLTLAEDIAQTCHDMYESTPTKLSPDVVHVTASGFHSSDAKYILRPETVETYFYLWRVTKKPQYRKWGAEILDACNRHLKVERGYVGTTNVFATPSPYNDMLETFWFAETLKYLLLLFSDDSALDLKKFVFNTEAHPLRVLGGGGGGAR